MYLPGHCTKTSLLKVLIIASKIRDWLFMRGYPDSYRESNHVHLVIERRSVALEDIMRDLKKHTSKAIIKAIDNNPQESRRSWMLWMFERAGMKNSNNSKFQFWQQHNQPIELTQVAFAIESSIDYIHNNPITAGFVDRPEHYPYSSAVDFAGGKGLVDIEPC